MLLIYRRALLLQNIHVHFFHQYLPILIELHGNIFPSNSCFRLNVSFIWSFLSPLQITNLIRMHFKKFLSRIRFKRNPYSMMFHISYTGVHVSVRFSLTITSVNVVWEHLPIPGKNGVPVQFDIFMACCETYQTNLLYSEVACSLVHFLSLVKCWPQFSVQTKSVL